MRIERPLGGEFVACCSGCRKIGFFTSSIPVLERRPFVSVAIPPINHVSGPVRNWKPLS